MTETVELRWFQRGPIPPEARAWFDGVFPIACVETRVDRYLVPDTDECGRKLREGRAEVKIRIGAAAPVDCGAAAGTPTVWRKRTLQALPERASVAVAKQRWLGRRESADGVCTLELSDVEIHGEPWWSVCLEAAGPGAGGRERAFREGVHRWLRRPDVPTLPRAAARAYPAWLRHCCG